MKLQVLSLSQGAFYAYGDVIETQKQDLLHINNSLVECYHDLALAEIFKQDYTFININRAQPANLPLIIHELEHHPLDTQVFIPMKGEMLVVVMASGDDEPDLSTPRVLITNDEQGANYHRSVWHHSLSAWQRATDFPAIDRGGSDNCDVESIPGQELCFA